MKKGLTYISERTNQWRYANNQETEEWVQQTSTYIPLVEIKRGQPVSVATVKDLEIVANGDEEMLEALKTSSDTYIVLTNPSRHESTIGLALEYTTGAFSLKDGVLTTSPKIHILGQGKYIEDKDYYANAFTEADEDSLSVENEEYWPEFFNDYENSIGKKIYIKGDADGILTLVPEEAYLAYNNVIVVGFVSDAKINKDIKQLNVGAIEVQILGDDRGSLDATIFEAIVGEDFTIGHRFTQANNEVESYTKVFALGADDDEKFKFSFNFFENQNKTLPKGFIAIQRIDGATAYVCVNGEISEQDVINNEDWTAEDRAFVQVAQYYAALSGNANTVLGVLDYDNKRVVEAPSGLETLLSQAFAAVSAGEIKSLKDGKVHEANALNLLPSNDAGVYKLEANDVGGTYEVYISSNLRDYVTGLYVDSRGANYNKGYAVLADIRFATRQNLIGIYNSGKTGTIKQGTRAIFLRQGLFTDPTSPYQPGATYYLGSHGNIFLVPQEHYNSIVQIGFAQTEKTMIVSCSDPRKFNIGDLPVGYMKPSVKGNAEFGFWLMDGKTPHKIEDAPHLYKNLLELYDKSELDVKVREFTTDSGTTVSKESFIIPAVQYKTRFSEENTTGYVPAQIKWLAEAVYKEMPRTPFVRRLVTVGGNKERAVLPDIDITSLMIYGPDEDRMQVPDLETLDIKLFVDVDKASTSRNWVQIEPGFHTVNNFTYYGFKWTVKQIDKVDASHPYGTYVLRAVYSGTENEDTANQDTNVLGLCMQADPFAPPVSLAGYEAKVFVTKHDYYSRQFDVENIFGDIIKESVTDATGKPWEGYGVSGNAVRKDIKYRVDTDNLDISDEDNFAGTVDAYINHIYLQATKDEIEETDVNGIAPQVRNKFMNGRKIMSDVRFANPSNNDVWNLDYFRGALEYFTSDENVTKENLEARLKNRPLSLMPYFMFKKHEDAKVADEEVLKSVNAEDSIDYPHGIKNTGFGGTLNADQLQGAHLGYGEFIFSQNADDTVNSEDSGAKIGNATITIPYIQKYDNKYTMRIGNVLKHYHGTTLLETEELTIDTAAGVLRNKCTLPAGLTAYKENIGGLTIKANYEENEFDFLLGDSDTDFAKIRGIPYEPSSIKYKYLLHSYANDNADTSYLDMFSQKDKSKGFDEPMNEALQAIYELPLATWQYNRQYEETTNYDKDSYFKRFFGIIVEQTANTSKKFKETETMSNATSLDEVAYKYTDAERASIAEYLKLMMDDKNVGFNTNNAVGILLKAAKETQERLLNLEVSTFGKDSPTLPGADTKNPDLKANDQKATVAGLNRLVKALCREVFQDADPSKIDDKGAWSQNSENYSRLDMLDKEVNGQAATEDEGQKDRIALADVSTYPDDASVTQTVEIARDFVKDADKDNDFDSAQKYIKDVTYTDVDGTSDEFDGLNDAVNRIVAKLNTLTADVKGSDNIKNRPLKLDYIRQTLETILRDVYDDEDVTSETLENGAYKKAAVSRIDRLIEELYNFDLETVNKVGSFKKFNNKNLKYNVTSKTDDGKETEVAALSPESLAELKDTASIIDVIIQLLTGDEKKLVRTDNVVFKDRELTDDGYKVAKSDETTGVTYNPVDEGFIANNSLKFNNKSIIDRLNDIEKVLELISLKIQNKLDFNSITQRVDASPYHNVTSIDDFFNYVENVFGITFEKDGFYATERKNSIKAETLNTVKGKTAKKTGLDLYNIIYDAVKRIKNNEWAIKYNQVTLGNEYDDYDKTKDTYEELLDGAPTHTRDYTLTSDMKAILKLLYGGDSEPDDEVKNNKTVHGHFKTADEREDNFVHSTAENGVSVLDELYTKLYTVPKVIERNKTTAVAGDYNSMSNYANLHYDPMSPRTVVPSNDTINASLLGNGRRSKFIAQDGTDHPLSRIDILENEVKAIYKLVGFGDTSCDGYYSGNLTFSDTYQSVGADAVASELWGSDVVGPDEANNGVEIYINGSKTDGVHNRYHEYDITGGGAFHLSAIALQAYFNTVDIADLLTSKDNNGKRIAVEYKKDALNDLEAKTEYKNIETDKTAVAVSSACGSTSYKGYSLFGAIQKALDYTKAIDSSLMNFKKSVLEDKDIRIENDKQIWAALGNDYALDKPVTPTVTSRLHTLETEVGTDDNKGSLFSRVATNEASIDKLRKELGSEGQAAEKTVYDRIETLEASNAAVIKSIENVDDNTAEFTADENEAVFKNLKPSTATDDKADADTDIVLATKASVESLVGKAVAELQREMTAAIQNNRILAAMMAYMKCDNIVANDEKVQFERNGGSWDGYDMQEANLAFNFGDGSTGKLEKGEHKNFCGEDMIQITLEDYVDHLKFTAFVHFNNEVKGTSSGTYANQTFTYGSNNNATSLDDDSYTVRIY